MRKVTIALGALALVAAGAGGWYASQDRETRDLIANLPTDRDVLMWKQEQRDAAFRAMDRLPTLAKANEIAPSAQPFPLPKGKPLDIPDIDKYMAGQRSAGIVIIHNGEVRFE